MARARSRDPERFRRLVPVVLLLASLLSLTISTRSLVGFPARVGLTVLGFFQKGFSAVSEFVSGTVSSMAELKRLRTDYDALLLKLERYDRLERESADIRAENERLKEQLDFAEGLPFQRIPVRIIAKDPENLYATMVIDKGVEEGIRKNMPVVAVQNGVEGLVGRVLEVGRGTSIVVPLYDTSSYVAARLVKTRHEGLVCGSGSIDGNLLMKYVRKRAKDEAQQGDLVVSSGYESIYPPDLALGRVKRIRALDYETSIEIELEPVLDFSRLEYLFVIRAQDEQAPAGDKGGQ